MNSQQTRATPRKFSVSAALAWLAVGAPLLYGVLQTLSKVTALFQ